MKNKDRNTDVRQTDMKEYTHLLLDAMPFCSNFWSREYKIVDCNQEALNLFGFTDKAEYLKRYKDFSPSLQPDGRPSVEKAREALGEAFAKGRAHLEWTFRKPDGEEIPADVTLVRVNYGPESVVISHTRDLRELRASMAEAHEAEERVRIMLDSTPMCCNFWDENQNNIDCNQEAVNLFGLSSKQEYLDRFFELSPEHQPDGRLSREKAGEKIREAFATGWARFEWLHQKLNGDPIPAEIILVRVRRGSKYVVAGYTRDLRELKQTVALLAQLERLAFTDALTGIYNRRRFIDNAQKAFVDFSHTHKPLSIIMMDIDHFKEVNDTWGHAAGDEVLKLVTREAQAALRNTDLLARYGGEEFVILVPDADGEIAFRLAERIRSRIAATPFEYAGNRVPVTVSLGVATKNDPSSTLEDVIELSDKALYRAKSAGRNRVAAPNGAVE